MGGGCICDNYLNTCSLNSPDYPNDIISLEKGKNPIQNGSYNKISNKASNSLYNILDKNKDSTTINKRYSDFHNYEKKHLEQNSNLKNITNKISNIEGPNTSVNDASFLHLKNYNNNFNNNEEITKKLSSNNYSSNFNESNIYPANSKPKGNEIIEEENNSKNNFDSNHHKHQVVMNKIKKKEENNFRKSDTNINCNLGENNFIFINISRGSSFMNNNAIEKFEATTPKMMLEKENIEEVAKGNKNMFSHFCKNRMDDKSLNHHNYNNQFIPSAFIPIFDMNKYSEEMLNVINSIRANPEFLIKHIDYLKDNNISKTDEGIILISHEVDEKIKLMDNYIEIFDKTKEMLRKIINSSKDLPKLEKMVYKDDLEIILDEPQYNEDDYDVECEEEEEEEEEKEEEKDIIDIKKVSTKLNSIYDNDDICISDDEKDNDNVNANNNDKDQNNKKIKNISKEKLNIIDFDNEDEDEEEIWENKRIRPHSSRNNFNNLSNSSYKIMDNNDNDNDNDNQNYKYNNRDNKYKIVINKYVNNYENINNNKIKKYKKKPKTKKKRNINNYLDLNDDKIANLILQKRKEIKKKYPKNVFKMSVIKDIKISILIQIIMEEFYNENNNNLNLLKDIIFSPKFKNFAVSWTNEINRNFISISCFA